MAPKRPTRRARSAARRPRVRGVALGLLLALLVPVAASAGTPRYTAARKFGRGLGALTTCFLEVPGKILQTSRQRGPAWGWTLGVVEGLARLVVRVPVGVYETLSAPFPLPPAYEPIIEPEYPWGYFDAAPAGRSRRGK